VGNTLVFDGRPGDPSTTLVRNTDVPGLESALRAAGVTAASSALLVGNGATARSAICGVARLGVTTAHVLARDPAKTAVLASLGERFGVEVRHLDWAADVPAVDLALSSAPAAAVAAVAPKVAAAAPVVFDAIYDPWPTALADAADAAGCTVVNGLDLLAHQAVGQVALMTGREVPAEVLLTAGRQALTARRGA
jgi:shikimate dehydrogenase